MNQFRFLPGWPWMTCALPVMVLLFCGCKEQKQIPPPQVVPVIAAKVAVQTVTNFVQHIGQTLGAKDVEIRARVAGLLESIHFPEGGYVQEGTLLYSIDDRPFKATYQQALAQLTQATTEWQKSRQDTNRFGPLWKRGAISRQQYDDAVATELSRAATVNAAEAAVTNAAIQLGYCQIHAPISGIAGKSELSVGSLVGQAEPTLLTTISKVNPIFVRFSVSEQNYLQWRRQMPANYAAGNGIFELTLADGITVEEKGSLVFGDRDVDPTTGTFLLQVAFPNTNRVVRPGQFARVRFPVEVFPDSITVPQSAVQELQANYNVFVVNGDKAEVRRVTLGPRVGTFYVIKQGLKAGETVVLEGLQKLQNNSLVSVSLTNLPPLANSL